MNLNDELAIEDLEMTFQAIDEEVKLLEQYKMVLDEIAIISKTNPKGVITYVNDKFCEISEFSREELIGQKHNIVRHPDMPAVSFKELWWDITHKKIWTGIVKNKKKHGQAYYLKTTIFPIVDVNNQIIEYLSARFEITELFEKSLLADLTSVSCLHKNWFEMTRELLQGDFMDIECLPIAGIHECGLGRWLDEHRKNCLYLEEIQEIEDCHNVLHLWANKAKQAKMVGDKGLIDRYLQHLEASSQDLNKLLEDLMAHLKLNIADYNDEKG